jgi:hypothetical protein
MSVFPILIAYESSSVASFQAVSEQYVASLTAELSGLKASFAEKGKDIKLRFQLIFVPMGKKHDVVQSFDKLLEPFL